MKIKLDKIKATLGKSKSVLCKAFGKSKTAFNKIKAVLGDLIRKCREIFLATVKKGARAHARRNCRIKITKFNKQKGEAFLVIHNRTTDYDRKFIEKAFGERMYDADTKKEGVSFSIPFESDFGTDLNTETNPKATVATVRALGLPIALFRIEGGYAEGKKGRKTKHENLRAGVSKVIYPKALSSMSDSELIDIMSRELKAE